MRGQTLTGHTIFLYNPDMQFQSLVFTFVNFIWGCVKVFLMQKEKDVCFFFKNKIFPGLILTFKELESKKEQHACVQCCDIRKGSLYRDQNNQLNSAEDFHLQTTAGTSIDEQWKDFVDSLMVSRLWKRANVGKLCPFNQLQLKCLTPPSSSSSHFLMLSQWG